MYRASGPHSILTIAATSSGAPSRPIGGTPGRCGDAPGTPAVSLTVSIRPGHDAVDGDPMRREFECERLGHSREARLGGDDVRPLRRSPVSGLAANVHDSAVSASHEMRQAGLRAQERTVQDDRKNAPPIDQRHVRKGLLRAQRRIVHQRIDAAIALDRRRHHCRDSLGLGHIGDETCRLSAVRLDQADGLLRVTARAIDIDHHAGAAGRPATARSPGRCCGRPP